MSINIQRTQECLQRFDFTTLFVEELGWSNPLNRDAQRLTIGEQHFVRHEVAHLAGVVVFEIAPASSGQRIPDARTRAAIHKEVSKHHHENLLIFVDAERSRSLWYWVKRQDGRLYPRDHHFFRGQPGDLLLGKLNSMVFDISEFDESGNVPLLKVTGRLKEALDVERITKKFYGEFQTQQLAFMELIEGIDDDHDRRWYASVLLNRLMFIYFLQKKFFLDGGDTNYLRNKLAASQAKGCDRYFKDFLSVLFFEGFAKPPAQRSAAACKLLGDIRYLNGGLFLPHKVEQGNPRLDVSDRAFESLFDLFERYSWNLDDTPGGQADEINPDVLGYIFEKYINQKAFGAYYTRPEITEYLCERTIHRLVLDAVNTPGIPGVIAARHFDSVGDMLMDLDAPLCQLLLKEVLPSMSLLDPACGSGAFLVAAMKTLISLYSAVIGRIKFLGDDELRKWLTNVERTHASVSYFIKKRIITDNLFGVDIMDEAVEIAKLRLFLALVASARKADELEPLPHIDFNILPGNSLIGLMRVDDKRFEARNKKGALGGMLFQRKTYREILAEKNRKIDSYRHTESLLGESSDAFRVLTELRDDIQKLKDEADEVLNDMLLAEFTDMGIRYEQAAWDDKKGKAGRSKKRPLGLDDLHELKPFHWGYEFDEILNERGGFDAIITNPPWEIFKPNAKEFFEEHSELVTKKKMTIHDFEKEQAKLLKDKDIRAAWLEYLSSYPHISAFYRSAPQYRNQISIVKGKKAGSDINLFKLFTEQCFNLLRKGGQCGIVIPSGIYTDLGAKQLRTMLFEQAEVTGLFCIENRKEVFENVHRSFKFVVLTFAKGGKTKAFPAAFMRHDVAELDRFPDQGSIDISVDLVKRLSPDSLSVMEFKNDIDVRICEKALRFPLLGEHVEGTWKLSLYREFDMTNHSHLFKTSPGEGRLPLYEGKMIWHFDHRFAEPRYWVDEKEGRTAILGRTPDTNQKLDYQAYRLGFRDIASNTNERTMVSSVIPPTFHGNKVPTVRVFDENEDRFINDDEQLFLCAMWNSYVVDYLVRMKVTTTLNFFYVYQLPVPRMTPKDNVFGRIAERAARLICTTAEFDDLAKEVGLKSHKDGAIDPAERAKLRGELDGLIAHLYGLTEEEFAYILTTFPLVPDSVKVATQNAYRDVERGLVK
ncbi:MAG TPA: ATP-binding protein [Bacillota bacterium]|nr:ATP-binding protein [Bacillota bacterium]